MAITSIKREFIGNPNTVLIETTDSLVTITTAGYLETQESNIELINHGPFEWQDGDMCLINYGNGEGFFTRDAATNSFVANVDPGSLSETLAHNAIFVGNASNVATGVPVSGDATIDDTGALTVNIATNVRGGEANRFVYQTAEDVTDFLDVQAGAGITFDTTTPGTLVIESTAEVQNVLDLTTLVYSAGTASLSGTTVTGVGTVFTADMVGGLLTFTTSGNKYVVSEFVNSLELSVAIGGTEPSGAYTLNYSGVVATDTGTLAVHVTGENWGALIGPDIMLQGDSTAQISSGTGDMTVSSTAGNVIVQSGPAQYISLSSNDVRLPNLAAHSLVLSQANAAVTAITLSNNQVALGSTGNDPVPTTLTAGSGITFDTSTPGVFEISANSGNLDYLNLTTQTYTVGTASQSGTTITGVGTTFTSGMVGGIITYADNTSTLIRGFVSTTELIATDSLSKTDQSYSIGYNGIAAVDTGYLGITQKIILNSDFSDGSTLIGPDNATGTIGIVGSSATISGGNGGHVSIAGGSSLDAGTSGSLTLSAGSALGSGGTQGVVGIGGGYFQITGGSANPSSITASDTLSISTTSTSDINVTSDADVNITTNNNGTIKVGNVGTETLEINSLVEINNLTTGTGDYLVVNSTSKEVHIVTDPGDTGTGAFVHQDQPTINQPVINGSTNGATIGSGVVGQTLFSDVASGSAVALTTGTNVPVTTLNLPAGYWLVCGTVGFLFDASTTVSKVSCGISNGGAVQPADSGLTQSLSTTFTTGEEQILSCGPGFVVVNAPGPLSVNLLANADFAVSTASAYGIIQALRYA